MRFSPAITWLAAVSFTVACSSCTGSSSDKPDSSTDTDTDSDSDTDADTDTDTDTDTDDCVHPPVVEDCSNGWCNIPDGCYIFGSPVAEPCRWINNEVQVQVTLTNSFIIKKHEITQAEWTAAGFPNPSVEPHNNNKPVGFIDWFETLAYCNYLSQQEGLDTCYNLTGCTGTIGDGCPPEDIGGCGDNTFNCTHDVHKYANFYECPGYRLATSAEWEYAARAGTTTSTYNGNVTTDDNSCQEDPVAEDIMWYCNNTTEIKPISLKQPNNWGLHDMLGNIWEWTDYVEKGLNLAQTVGQDPPLTDPVGDGVGNRRDLRGGSYINEACNCRLAKQYGTSPEDRGLMTGFRPVRTLNPPPQPDAGVDAGKTPGSIPITCHLTFPGRCPGLVCFSL